MTKRGDYAPERTGRLMKQTELTHHGPAVVVNALAGESLCVIKGKDTTKWKFYASTRWRDIPSPGAQMSASNGDLQNNRVTRDVPMSYFDRKVRQ